MFDSIASIISNEPQTLRVHGEKDMDMWDLSIHCRLHNHYNCLVSRRAITKAMELKRKELRTAATQQKKNYYCYHQRAQLNKLCIFVMFLLFRWFVVSFCLSNGMWDTEEISFGLATLTQTDDVCCLTFE